MPETLIQFGGAVKALGDGRFEAPLVTFGTAKKHDLAKDFFTAQTDYWTDFPTVRPMIYNHGLDKEMKSKRIGVNGSCELELRDAAVWMTGQLKIADDYQKAIYTLIEEEKIGTSSGSASHLVERKSVDGAYEILSWPIVEASLTPEPCEFRNRVVPIKSWGDHLKSLTTPDATKGAILPGSEEQMLLTALQSLNSLFLRYVMQCVGGADWRDDLYGWSEYAGISDADDDGEPIDEAMLRSAFDEYRDTALRAVAAMQSMPEVKSAQTLLNLFREPATDDVLTALKKMTISNFLATMGSVVGESERRVTWYDTERSVKSGRMHSASTLQTLKDVRKGLVDHAETLGAMIDRQSNHSGKSLDTTASEYARFLLMEARLMGVNA